MTKPSNIPKLRKQQRSPKSKSPKETREGRSDVQNRLVRQRLVTARSLRGKFLQYTGENLHGLQVIGRLGGTVIHAIFPWVLLTGAYGLVVSLLNQLGYFAVFTEMKALPHVAVALNVALSLLLVFRTNAAHERFWEGRKLWGSMVNTTRNLARSISLIIEEREDRDRSQKESAMRLVGAFAVAMKLHLRQDPMDFEDELETLMPPMQYDRLQAVSHGPLEISLWLGDYLQHQYGRGHVSVFQLQDLHKLVGDMVDILGGCERILKTPVPLIYTMTLKLLLVAYFIVVPLELVETLHWGVSPAITFISLIFLGIHEVSSEIEEPFGHDPNDLPLDFICNTIKRNVEELIQHAPLLPSYRAEV